MGAPGTRRWRGIGPFLVIVGGLFAVLRVAHVLLPPAAPTPVVRPLELPDPTAGPSEIRQASIGDVPVRMPFYRPKSIGSEPVFAAVVDQPVRRFVALWRSEHVLALELWSGDSDHRLVPEDAEPWSGMPEARAWRRGPIFCALAPHDGATVRLCTDLSEIEARRVLRSLRPLAERR